jgi:hypothetical protein
MPTLEERHTPRTDAWVDSLRPIFAEYGSRSEFARFVEGDGAPQGKIVRWTNSIARWLDRKELPNLEVYFLVSEWLGSRADGTHGLSGGKKAKPARRTAGAEK